jgi:glyoxylase-like metal-dependent hydrolase (beta-lactamase superfamily II)
MKLHTIETGFLKLDGGAMFGVVPKSIWNKLNQADDNNMCNWAMRCLLVEDGNKLILIDNGIGDKQDQKFFSYYYLSGNVNLSSSLKKAGYTEDDITDVFLTHLHFDHCGGSVRWNSRKDGYETVFKNATYWSNARHWEWATKPNAREKASFLKENILPISESGQLKFLKEGEKLTDNFDIIYVNGHTDAMMLPSLNYNGKKIIYCADLIPSTGHVPLPYVMAYDTRPLLTLQEKEKFLIDAVSQNAVLFFEHDPADECCILEQTDRGIKIKEKFPLHSV